ncbi:amidohydrolase [Sphingomonas sp. LH128]|uniref:Amidohydrolase n=1 Tax=Novosphingobium resinovorum TaxID=158500 RepID=A0A031J5I5_9SPHN|nr:MULTISPECIES: amidohydrolase family protein [Sphingomonadaceae]AOR79386.1 amidohydrolase [Novosphingobium resinovorum]EJU10780.1 amidohydrolase [Sphingomonas sp. LH128]EZP68516.1 Amidohydrolase [Novosphingobium resinovorum]
MKRGLLSLAAVPFAVLGAVPVAAQEIAIVHAEAWTMTGDTPLNDATVLIDGDRIVSVTVAGGVPAGAQVIDAGGKPVTPGLINGATQLGLVEVSAASDTRDYSAAKDAGTGPSFDVSYALNGNSTLVGLARADGVTSALSFPGPSGIAPFSGMAAIARLRPGADILGKARAAMFAVIGGGAWDRQAGSRAAQWGLLRAALDEAKLATLPSGDEFALKRQDRLALRPVLQGAMRLAIVTHRESDVRQAVRLAGDYRIKVVIVGGAEAWRAADLLAKAHIPVVLDPEANLPSTFDQIGARQENAAILTRAGVKVAFGLVGGAVELSYNAGLALREGAGLAVAAGLSRIDALRAITVNPAAIWGGRATTLAPGSAADIVVWDGDPLEPSTGAAVVIIEGKRASLTTRQSELERRYAPAVP